MVNYNATHHVITSWITQFYWFEALWNTNQLAFITNISLGLAVTFLVRVLAILYVINHIKDKNILSKTKKCLWINPIFFLIFFFIFIEKLFTISWTSYSWTWFDQINNYRKF